MGNDLKFKRMREHGYDMRARRIWVTGYGGFMGSHLVEMLESRGENVLASYYKPAKDINNNVPTTKVIECDIRDRKKVQYLIDEFNPAKIFHLAAQSYPTSSWDDPWYTIETNIIGTINILEGLKVRQSDCLFLNACSSAQYGYVAEEDIPVGEGHTLKPLHPYGISKVAQELLAYQYYVNFGIKTINVRIFNTTGPGKLNDVCSDFTRRLAEIEKGLCTRNILRIGNTSTRRAITDVRDMIRAFDITLDRGTIGETYNLSGDCIYGIMDLVGILRELVDFKFDIWQDPALMRPADEPIIFGSTEKFRGATGWRQEIPLRTTLTDMLEYWRRIL